MRKVTVDRSPTGESCGFLDLYDRTVVEVYSYVLSRAGERAVAEELTQDVFVAGARRLAEGLDVDVAWLIGVARHKLVDHWRALARRQRVQDAARSLDWPAQVEDPVAPDPGVASAVLTTLNPTYRTALVLRHVDGLSVVAVAEHLGRSLEATEQVLSRARASFRAEYRRLTDE